MYDTEECNLDGFYFLETDNAYHFTSHFPYMVKVEFKNNLGDIFYVITIPSNGDVTLSKSHLPYPKEVAVMCGPTEIMTYVLSS